MPGLIIDETAHAAKRQRLELPPNRQSLQKREQLQASRIFAPYRTVGLVSPTSVPFTSIPLGKTTFQITTSTGRALHTYDLRTGLQLVFITRPQTPAQITATCAWKDVVLAAWGDGSEASSAASNGHHDSHKPLGFWIYKRGQKITELHLPAGFTGPILKILVFGAWLVAASSKRLDIWKLARDPERDLDWEHYTTLHATGTLSVGSEAADFTANICTAPTLLNKVLVGRTDGSVEIWNVRTGRLVYGSPPPTPKCGSVTCIEPSPAVGVVAIARTDGTVVLQDIVKDKPLLRVRSDVPVTSIGFRTDGSGAGEDGQKDGVMATASTESGDLTLWDLNDGGRVQGVLRNAHNPPSSAAGGASGGISRIEFLSGQPVIISSGLDNSLKSWILDQSPFNPVPRTLHSRSGHSAPVARLQFLPTQTDESDAIGKWLLSASRDRSLWGWSLRRDGQSTELSQGNIKKRANKMGFDGKKLELDTSASLEDLKVPEITCIACCLNRDGGMGASTGGGSVWANIAKAAKDPHAPVTGWESMITGHKGDKFARTWFWGRKKAGRWALETGDKTEVTSVAMSPCGTFALVGSAGGSIDMFNLQSGILRQKFPRRLSPSEAKAIKLRRKTQLDNDPEQDDLINGYTAVSRGQHTRDVTGVAVDSMNRTVISCGLDGKVKFWNFMTGNLSHEIDKSLSGGITDCRYHRPSDLLALACDDSSIQVTDVETRKTVRELWGCVGQIKDLCFSNDGRWIVAASMDSIIRVWDLPTGHLIDAVRLSSVCTSLSFSPTGEFLATSHADSNGISIWSNRSLFKRIPTKHIQEKDIIQTTLPTDSGEGAQGLLAAAFEEEEAAAEEQDGPSSSTDQLSEDMTTLSLLPRSRWQTLLHLDLIGLRNKPTEPPKAPEKAPFFLPSLGNNTKNHGDGAQALNGSHPEGEAVISITESERSRISALQRRGTASLSRPFTVLLRQATTLSAREKELEAVVSHLKALNPASADIEIRSLSPAAPLGDEEDFNELAAFVRALTARLRQKRDYEVVQTWMAVFLKIHGEVVAGDAETRRELAAWKDVAVAEQKRLGALVGYCGGVIQFLRSAR